MRRVEQVVANVEGALRDPRWRSWAFGAMVVHDLPRLRTVSAWATPIVVRMGYRREADETWRADRERASPIWRSIGDCDDWALRHTVFGRFASIRARWLLAFEGTPARHVFAVVDGAARDGIPGTARWGPRLYRPIIGLRTRRSSKPDVTGKARWQRLAMALAAGAGRGGSVMVTAVNPVIRGSYGGAFPGDVSSSGAGVLSVSLPGE